MQTILVLDVGTSSMRGILFDTGGNILKTVQISNPPVYKTAELVEADPLRYASCLYRITREAVSFAEGKGHTVSALSLTAIRSCTLFCDEHGDILYPVIMWHDKRAEGVCQSLKEREQTVFERTGVMLSPVFSGPKYAWMRRNDPALYNSAAHLAVVPDYLLFLMCGKWVTDHTYGSRTAIMNIHTRTWDPEMLSLFGIDEDKLSPLIPPGSIAGETSEAFFRLTGLKTGTPVISAGGDQQCGLLGAGASSPGDTHITVGSGAYLSVAAGEPVIDPRRRFVCGASAAPGQTVLEASILSSAVLYNWFFREFYPGEAFSSMKDTVDREAGEAPAGCGGVLFLPYFQGRGSPDWNPSMPGGFLHLSLETSRGAMARAILEGIASEIAENEQILRSYSSGRITVGGGMTASPLFTQILADFLGRPIRICAEKETTALGAFFSALSALGHYESPAQAAGALLREGPEILPDPSRHALYGELLEKRKKLCEVLK